MRVHALAAGARTARLTLSLGGAPLANVSEAWRLCAEQEAQRCWDFCFCKWLGRHGGLRASD